MNHNSKLNLQSSVDYCSYKEYSYLDNVFDDEVYATIHQVNAFNNVHNLDLMSNASSSSNPQENANYTSDSENYNVSL